MVKEKEKFLGFLLFEIVLVFSLFAILCAFAFPSFARYRSNLALLGVAQNVASTIRLARIEAIEGGVNTRIIFDVAANRLLFRGKDGKTKVYPLPAGVTLYTTNFPSHILSFYPQGTPSCGGTVTLKTLEKLRYVIVAPVTGRVRISDSPP
ncbi:MAG: GspH/FimT family pseudopilin [Candidatus Caldatribacteriaceae bacterium]